MWTTPEKHTKRRETLGNTYKNSWVQCVSKKPQRKHSALKEPYEMLHKTKTLTTIARWKKAKEKALKQTS